jgi:hypothetical protein
MHLIATIIMLIITFTESFVVSSRLSFYGLDAYIIRFLRPNFSTTIFYNLMLPVKSVMFSSFLYRLLLIQFSPNIAPFNISGHSVQISLELPMALRSEPSYFQCIQGDGSQRLDELRMKVQSVRPVKLADAQVRGELFILDVHLLKRLEMIGYKTDRNCQ